MTIDRNSKFLTREQKDRYDGTYTTVQTNSAAWAGGGGGGVTQITKDTIATGALTFNGDAVTQSGNTFTFTQATPVDLTDVSSASGGWNSTETTVRANSATTWNYQGTDLKALSAGWQSNYSTVNTNSAIAWNYQGTDIKNLSGNWQSTYLQVSTLSANWNNHANLTDLIAASGGWNSAYSTVNSTSADWQSTRSTVNTNSATTWNYQGTDLKGLSANWQTTYLQVCALSASWAGGGGGGSDVSTISGNWESTYSTVESTSGAWNTYSSKNATIGCTFNGMGSALNAGLQTYLTIPYDCIVQKWFLVANTTGNLVIDVWNDTWANFPPTVADTIAGSEKPTLVSQQVNKDETLSTWSVNISSGDVMAFRVDSCNLISQATLTLQVEKI